MNAPPDVKDFNLLTAQRLSCDDLPTVNVGPIPDGQLNPHRGNRVEHHSAKRKFDYVSKFLLNLARKRLVKQADMRIGWRLRPDLCGARKITRHSSER
jgi:hypothetical protein